MTECTICRHPALADINDAIESGLSDLAVAQRWSLAKDVVRRHVAHAGLQRPAQGEVVNICAVCAHPKRIEIEAALSANQVWSAVSKRFFVDAEVLKRHAKVCAPGVRKGTNDGDAHSKCLEMVNKAMGMLEDVDSDPEASHADKAKMLTAVNSLVVSLGRFTGELSNATEITIVESPKWKRIAAAISEELAQHPDIAARVAKRLQELDAA